MSINVTVVGSTGVSTSIANSDSVVVAVGGTLANTPLTALQITAGANITLTTTSGVYTIIGPNVPVQSVNGQTGAVSLTLTNLTAAAVSHTHVMANISDLAFPVNTVNGKTGTVVLTSTDVSAASAVHSHVASDITNLTSVANVVSVNGITGTPVIVGGVGVTVSTAGSSITIEAVGGTSEAAGLSDALPQGFGTPAAGTSGLASRSDHVHAMPSAADVGAAPALHTHAASAITDFTSVANVVSVNGRTGAVSLTTSDITAAASTHTHAYVTSLNSQTGALSIVAGSNVTVSTSVGSITIASPAPGDALPSQGGNANRVLETDGTSASWVTRYAVVEPVLVAGSGVSFAKNTAAGTITVAASAGGGGDSDAGEYTGVTYAGITIISQPQNQTVTASSTVSWASTADASVPAVCRGFFYDGTTLFGLSNNSSNVTIYKRSGGSWSSQQLAATSNSAPSYMAKIGNRLVIMFREDAALASVYYSDDAGATWTAATVQPRITALASSGSRLVACGDKDTYSGTTLLLTSASGVSWGEITSTGSSFPAYGADGERYYNVAYGGGRFVAVGEGQGTFANNFARYNPIAAISTDGLGWSVVNLPGTQMYAAIAYGDGKWVAVCNGFRSYYYSDGTNSSSLFFGGRHIINQQGGDPTYVGHLSSSVTGSRRVAISTDNGATWTGYDNAMPFVDNWNTIAYGGGYFIAFGTGVDAYATSKDGINWTSRTLSSSLTLGTNDGVAWDGQAFFAGGTGREKITPTITGSSAPVTFGVVATSTAASPTYQWEESLDGGATWSPVSGATSDTLSFSATSSDSLKRYRVAISSTGTQGVTSGSALLTVNT